MLMSIVTTIGHSGAFRPISRGFFRFGTYHHCSLFHVNLRLEVCRNKINANTVLLFLNPKQVITNRVPKKKKG